MLDFFLPCARKEPHYRIYSRLRLILRWEDFLRPDRDAPEQSADLLGPQTICNYTTFSRFVKPL